MKCADINDLLYLKDDELSPEERDQVKAHLLECRLCAAEYIEIKKAGAAVDLILNREPFLIYEEEFTGAVIEKIEKTYLNNKTTSLSKFLDYTAHFFGSTGARAASAAVIIILISTFLIQQYFVLSSVETLENKIAITAQPKSVAAGAGFSGLEGLKTISGLYGLIEGNRFYAEFPGGMIIADKSKLDRLLSIYGELMNYKHLYSKEIEREFPELNSFTGRKLSVEELQDFIKKNENAIKEFSRKFPAGGK